MRKLRLREGSGSTEANRTPRGICVCTVGVGVWAQQGKDPCPGTVTQWVSPALGGAKTGVAGPRVSHCFPRSRSSELDQHAAGESVIRQ